MKTWLSHQRSFSALLIFKTLYFLGLIASAAVGPPQPLDVNGDNIPDIWALRYQAGALNPAHDSDGDGASNASESSAGTDPLASGSVIRVSSITKDIAGVRLTFPTLPGKRYQVQENASVDAGTWSDIGALQTGTGGEVEATVAAPGTTKFFRVYVLDVDTDNDGVTDYEEILAGYNPNSPTSFGASGLTDKEALLAALNPSTVNTVSVQAADDAATEPSPVDTGLFVITRVGKLTPVTVNFTVAGTAVEGSDYIAISRSVTLPFGVNTAAVTITPETDALIESPESVILAIASGTDYLPPGPSTQPAALLIHDRTTPNGTGLSGRYWNELSDISASTAARFTGPPVLTRTDATVNFNWGTGSPALGLNTERFSARWTGEVLPEFSQIYTFFFHADDAVRVWVNGKLVINAWPRSGDNEVSGTIELLAGMRVPIVIEYYEITGGAQAELRWQSANQAKVIIPTERLFPATPPRILSPLDVLLIQNSPAYNYQIVASGEPTSFGASNLPPGWTFNSTTGLISGTPDTVGTWRILLTATNAHGSGSEILTLNVIGTGNQITREVWTDLPGTDISSIPLNSPPDETGFVTDLEVAQNDIDNFGSRIRGSLTAPATGSYRFWITADDTAELWISNDNEEVNSFLRAVATAPTTYHGWTEAGAGKSDFLWLEAGKQYYIEVRHKEDNAGTNHVSVGWLKPGEGGVDPTAATEPTEVVPSFVLSPYAAGTGGGQGTLFYTNLTPQGGVVTSASGNILLRLSEDETQAVITVNYSNLTTPYFGMHLHDPNIPGGGLSNVVCDFDEPGDVSRQQDGTWLWVIKPRGAYTAEQIVDHIKNPTGMGPVFFNVHSTANTGGEIRGNLKQLQGSQTFAAPAAAPAAPADHTDANAAARFLTQSTFGVQGADVDADGTPDSIEEVQSAGSYEAWIDAQIAMTPTLSYPYVFTNRNLTSPGSSTYDGSLMFRSWWKNSITAPDQLRQRVAFALSEIFVISEAGPLDDKADALSDYYDTLLYYSLGDPAYIPPTGEPPIGAPPPADGNFHNLIKAVTLHPAMGRYLDMLRNDKPDPATGRIPNENYAREILQLFSIGLYRQWPDGSLMLNSRGEPVPTYGQDEVVGFSHVFTGWGYHYAGGINASANSVSTAPENWLDPMREIPRRHYIGAKRTLNNVVLPGLPAIGGVALDPNANHTQFNDPAYIALPDKELEAALQQISKHPNTGPFICRQLIQRLVTSTPSRGYIHRVVQKFNDNGSGVSGDMKAVIKAILLDYEARSSTLLTQQGFGKQREPIARVAAIARAFPAPAPIIGYYSQTGNLISVSVSPAVSISNGSNVYLDFNGATPSDAEDAAYTVSNVSTVGNETTFTARPKSTEGTATYSQTAASLVINVPDEHSFTTGSNVYLDFTSGTTPPADGVFTVTSAYKVNQDSNDYFTVPAPNAQRATYNQASGSDVITVTFPADHGYVLDQQIHIDFVTAGAPSGLFTVTPISSTQLTVTAAVNPGAARNGNANVILPAAIVARNGDLVATRESYSVNRSGGPGSVALTFSDWGINDTETDLSQTPMRSPTVFNFFEPDYSFPGLLAQAGLITPEFQLTSDTTVMRQANFIYNGIFNDLHIIKGIASFNSGNRDIALDFRKWLGAGPGGLPWTHNDNLGAFVDKLNLLLMAGQLPSTGVNNTTSNPRNIVNAKSVITEYAQSLPYDFKVVTGVSASSLTTVTVSAHGYTSGQSVIIAGVAGSGFNNGTYTLTVTGPDTFTVPTSCTTLSANLVSATATVGGVSKPITGLSGFCTVNVSEHGMSAGQAVTISGVTGGAFTPAINGEHIVASSGTTSFVVPVTRTSSIGQSTTNARISIAGLFPDRVRAVVHLMVTSPDFTIQK